MTAREYLDLGFKKEELVRAIEKAFRSLPEYEIWSRSNRKPVCEWKDCPITGEISPLQVHHYPMTLYEVVEQLLEENLQLAPYEILGKVVGLHLEGEVDNISLCKFHHGMFHELTRKGVDPSPLLALRDKEAT